MGRAWVLPIAVAAIAALIVAGLGMTMTEIGPWYFHLAQPRWAPPPQAYGIAWTAIYSLAALAGVTAWRATPDGDGREWLIGMFALNGILNIVWSFLFFRLHRPDWALYESLLLWLSVLSLVLIAWRRSIVASIMLLPYLAWVTFAGYLTMNIVRLNGPFY